MCLMLLEGGPRWQETARAAVVTSGIGCCKGHTQCTFHRFAPHKHGNTPTFVILAHTTPRSALMWNVHAAFEATRPERILALAEAMLEPWSSSLDKAIYGRDWQIVRSVAALGSRRLHGDADPPPPRVTELSCDTRASCYQTGIMEVPTGSQDGTPYEEPWLAIRHGHKVILRTWFGGASTYDGPSIGLTQYSFTQGS